ncbi:MAG: GNAT family N-acetyltransferase [Pseudomonadota bacterium]
MLEFRKVTMDDVRPLCRLHVPETQQKLVSPNAYTLAEMQFEPGAYVRGMWVGEQPVGLLGMLDMRAFDGIEDEELLRDAAYLWRLMVGDGHQGKGYGGQAIEVAKATAGEWGFDRLSVTVLDDPEAAVPFYERHGFRLTGRTLFGSELEMLWMG